MAKKKKANAPLKPLREFDFGLVNKKMQGLLINVDRDLQRKAKETHQRGDHDGERCMSLLNVMVRFAHNSYNAVLFLSADVPPDPDRKPNYVLVVPNINRQLLDLLFSLVYMMDDLSARSLEYQRAGWRELTEEYKQYHTRFAKDPEWKTHFELVREVLKNTADRLQITTNERKDPSLVPYWDTPTHLKNKNTKSRPFLRYLDKWLYGDTSAQAHFSFGGVLKVAPFILAAVVGGQEKDMVENRTIHMYRYQHFSRTAIIALAIATEMNRYYKLGNDEQADFLWTIFSEFSAEGKEMFDARYRTP